LSSVQSGFRMLR